jgi:hypothetical protein
LPTKSHLSPFIIRIMKTKELLLSLLVSVIGMASQHSFAQDVSINLTPGQGSILNFTQGDIQVKLCNEDPSPITAPANKLRPIVSVPDNLTIVGLVNDDFSPLTNWTVVKMTNNPSDHTVILRYTSTLANADCIAFRIIVEGNTVGGGIITGSLAFQGPQTPGNLTANDNSTAAIPVDLNLPVTLKDFLVKPEGETAMLNWATTEETNSDHFDVQRSRDGKKWVTFETVSALGESKKLNTYNVKDNNPLDGENFYRLHMFDKDGSNTYSSIRQLSFKLNNLTVFPNPASGMLNIKAKEWDKVSNVELVNAKGFVVYKSLEKPEPTIDIASFAEGIYTIIITTVDGEIRTNKVMISK